MGLSPDKDGSITPMVAIRSNGLALDSIIGYLNEHGEAICIVPEVHLRLLIDIANERFKVNADRIERFRQAVLSAYAVPKAGFTGVEYEDAATRKARKRAEGLVRQQAVRAQKSMDVAGETDVADLTFLG
jgi:tRNA wybutosine-synthesizing protein 3